MHTFTAILLIILAIFAHEFFGHAMAIRKAGVLIKKIIIGLPGKPIASFPLRGKWAGTEIVFCKLPIAGFTLCDEKDISELPYWQRSRILAAGPIASIIFGCWLIILSGFIFMMEHPEAGGYPFVHLLTICLALIVVLGTILQFGGKIIFAFLAPLAPIVLLGLVGYDLLFLAEPNVTGPVALAGMANAVSSFSYAVFFAGEFSIFCIGIPMMLPLVCFGMPLDGQQMLRPIVEKYIPRALPTFESFGNIIFGLLVLYVLQKELAPILLPFIAKLL